MIQVLAQMCLLSQVKKGSSVEKSILIPKAKIPILLVDENEK